MSSLLGKVLKFFQPCLKQRSQGVSVHGTFPCLRVSVHGSLSDILDLLILIMDRCTYLSSRSDIDPASIIPSRQ